MIVSFVFPCLNEEQSVAACVCRAREVIEATGHEPDIVVVDNGCTDRSAALAADAGARVIPEPRRGYGQALRTGIHAARGGIIFMADADGTYELEKIPEYLRCIEDNRADLVIGDRFHDLQAGAMPPLHRYVGTPALNRIMRLLFQAGVRDVNCGMRAFTRDAYQRMNLVTTGMEFASEMVIRAFNLGLRVDEVGIRYGKRTGESKLETFRDGLRHLRLMLLYSPDFLFILPAVWLWGLGALIVMVLFPQPLVIGSRAIDVHTMLIGAILNLAGLHLGSLGIVAKSYGHFTGLRLDPFIGYVSSRVRLKHGILAGGLAGLVGLGFAGWVLLRWAQAGFGNILLVRELVLALVSFSNGLVIIATAFLLSLMAIPHSDEHSPYYAQPG